MSGRSIFLAGSILVAAASTAAGYWLDAREEAAGAPSSRRTQPVLVDGERVPDADDPEPFLRTKEDAILSRSVALSFKGQSLGTFSLRELGAHVDVDSALAAIEELTTRGARGHGNDVPLSVRLDADTLIELLELDKEELDIAARPARRLIDKDGGKDEVIGHREGELLDLYAAADAILVAAMAGKDKVDIGAFRIVPVATRDAIATADVGTLLGRFETRFGGPPGRNKNVERASSQLHGLVLMPNETVSFNDTVGPRTIENGFANAPEIYKGEMREGVGGGACQVASTMYAAAFYGGMDIIQRRNHSRPSGYIRPGMDATVSFPVLDLRIKNPYEFPVVVSARADKGALVFEMWGKEKRVDVELATETLAVLKYSRKIEKTSYLPEGEYRVKQKGKRGISIRRTKTVKNLKTGESTLEESTDLYPATQEILIVGPGVSQDDLPPLEPPASPDASATLAADAGGGA